MIYNFNEFLNELKLNQYLPDHLKKIVSKRHGDDFLDMEVPDHTDIIPNVRIEITDNELKDYLVKRSLMYLEENIISEFKKSTLNSFIIKYKWIVFESLDIKISMNSFYDLQYLNLLYGKNFRIIEEKKRASIDEYPNNPHNEINGITYVYSTLENPIFSNNRTSLFKFIEKFNKLFGTTFNLLDKEYTGLQLDIKQFFDNKKNIENAKLYLMITDNPTDKLLMSVSRYYSSCQNIYNGGDEGTDENIKLLSNVFDTNSKIALLIFDTPYVDRMGHTIEYTSCARCIIRYSGKIMFDQTYPHEMETTMYKIIEKYTGMKNNGKPMDVYNYNEIEGLPKPYMDRYVIPDIKDRVSNAYIEEISKDMDNNEKHVEKVIDKYYDEYYKIKSSIYGDNKLLLSKIDRNQLFNEINTLVNHATSDEFKGGSYLESLQKVINKYLTVDKDDTNYEYCILLTNILKEIPYGVYDYIHKSPKFFDWDNYKAPIYNTFEKKKKYLDDNNIKY
jgi:hypothetical protein